MEGRWTHLGPGPYWHEMLLFNSVMLRGANLFHVPIATRRSCLEMAGDSRGFLRKKI